MGRPMPLPAEAELVGLKAHPFVPEGVNDPASGDERLPIKATPFHWRDPRTIPPREWVYGWHYVRRFLSTTVAPGGVGKSSLTIVEALAICTGRPLLGVTPAESCAVWLWNGEDPAEELERRVGAAMLHFSIRPEDVEGRLFLDSGRTSSIVIAEQTKSGAVVAVPVVADLEATILENKIGVAILDPFVAAHRVSENDNGMIEQVAKALAGVADRTRAAVEVVHHVRKTGGAEVTVEDGRGASALLNAARCSRAINQMSQEEADKYGVENRRLYFHAYDGKANLAPPADRRDWFGLVTVDLGNETAARPTDHVGVVGAWQPPDVLEKITVEHLHEVRRRVGDVEYRKDPQAKEWIGKLVAEVAGLNLSDKRDMNTVKAAIASWLKSGALKRGEAKCPRGHLRPIIVRGEFNGG